MTTPTEVKPEPQLKTAEELAGEIFAGLDDFSQSIINESFVIDCIKAGMRISEIELIHLRKLRDAVEDFYEISRMRPKIPLTEYSAIIKLTRAYEESIKNSQAGE